MGEGGYVDWTRRMNEKEMEDSGRKKRVARQTDRSACTLANGQRMAEVKEGEKNKKLNLFQATVTDIQNKSKSTPLTNKQGCQPTESYK